MDIRPIHHAPEVAPSRDTAEVYYPPAQQSGLGSPYDYSSNTTSKPDNYHYYTQNHDPAAIASPYGYSVSPENHQPPGRRRTICGCSALVFMLSAIIAFLSAAVIGLAAGTGIFATKYNDAHSKVADGSSATTTSSATSPTSTDFSANTMGCADHADSTDGDEYKSILYDDSFTLKCNSNTPKTPLFSVFATDFRGCMESCSTWNGFGSLNDTLCEAVTYVPLWTNYDAANYSKAPGNCYLKPGPQSVSGLETPYPDLESHSAIRD